METEANRVDGATVATAVERAPDGKFLRGNRGGPGNPHNKRVYELRKVLLDAVGDDDLRAIVAALITQAKLGDTIAAREVLDRVLGKPKQSVEITGDGDPMDTRKWYGDVKTSAAELIAELHADKPAE